MKKIFTFCLAFFCFIFSQSQTVYLTGVLSGQQEADSLKSLPGNGVVIVKYDTVSRALQLRGNYASLTDTATMSHIHRGAPGVAGPVSVDVKNSHDSSGTLDTTATISSTLSDSLLSGNTYVNVHTDPHPAGEIRGQLTLTNPKTAFFAVNLTGAQEVPASTSTGTGTAWVLIDRTAGMLYVTGSFVGINSLVSKAEIHRGAAGDTGKVILSLTPSYVTSKRAGTFSGTATLPSSTLDSIINGLAYINIYSARLPNGAIRGQLSGAVLPLKLTYFNGYTKANKVELVWETSEEVNVSRYEIEQLNVSTNSWMTKGSVLPQGGTNATKYSFEDLPNLNGSQYAMYRLKMIDKDGKITYSSLIKLNFGTLKAELFIQTNPIVNGVLRYTITGLSTNKKAEISIIDFNGKIVLRNTTSSLNNNTLEISHLSAGMYKLIVKVDDTLLQKSFIK